MDLNDADRRHIAGIARAYLKDVDEAVGRAVNELSLSGLELSCAPGCASCCSLPVNATIPEAALAAEHVSNTFSSEGIGELLDRARSWLSWTSKEMPKLAGGMDLAAVYALHGPGCPLLRDGLCSIYSVRPMGCRVHCSTSEPALCGPGERDNPLYNPSGVVCEVVSEVKPLCMEYRHRLEGMGMDFDTIVMPLPDMLVMML